ncbi:MAG: methyltransferase [Bacteroidota bacterium]
MRRIIRLLLQPILWRAYRWYGRKERRYRMDDLTLFLAPSVFHPAWMLTTRTMTEFALRQNITDKNVLELGAGNGFLALSCQRAKAHVTATDINPAAIASLRKSSAYNQLPISIIESDLFEQIPGKNQFDYIFINPPYFPKDPNNDQERAYFCGLDFSYFKRLFQQLRDWNKAQVFMILTDDCELESIQQIAVAHGWRFELAQEQKKLGEMHLIYQLSLETEA